MLLIRHAYAMPRHAYAADGVDICPQMAVAMLMPAIRAIMPCNRLS